MIIYEIENGNEQVKTEFLSKKLEMHKNQVCNRNVKKFSREISISV